MTVYSCRNTMGKYFYKEWHSGKCPHCGGPLDEEWVNEIMYNIALP